MKRQHRIFVAEYLKDRNASAAYLRAGFKNKNPDVGAAQLMARPEVRAAVEEKIAKLEDEIGRSAKDVIKGFWDIYERCMQKVPVMEFDPATREMVQKVDPETGKGVWEFDATAANTALSWLGKHHKLFTEKVEINDTTDLAERLKRSRERAKKHG